MDRASNVAQTPYTAYTGQLTAGLSADQQGASQVFNNSLGAAAPYYNNATALAGEGNAALMQGQNYLGAAAAQTAGAAGPVNAEQFSGAAVDRYMSPYTDAVINATQGQIQHSNAMQANDLTTRGIQSGNAFGGDRLGVAQAELARNQDIAGNQTIAGLYNQNYSQALGEFNNQQGVNLSADQANASRAMQAAQQTAAIGSQYGNFANTYGGLAAGMGNIGTAYGNQVLNTGQALAGTGATQQQTQQAALSAAQGQFNQEQAFPYTQTQWLSGIQSGLGSLSGGTSSTTGPAPNPMNQILGLGATAAGAFLSDERAKENIKPVGKLFDGQPIYSYNYKGHPGTQIGLIAQNVEKHHPEAVGEAGGLKTVNYADATDDAADKGHFASGGSVVMPYAGGIGWIPNIETKHGSGVGIPAPPKIDDGSKSQQDLSKLGSGLGKWASNKYDNTTGTGETSAVAGASSGMMGGISFPMIGAGDSGGAIYARGGVARGFADGGSLFDDRLRSVEDAIASGDFDPVGANSTEFKAPGLVPMPRPRPREIINPDEPIRVQGTYAAGEPPMTPERAAANYAGTDDGPPTGAASRLPRQITGDPEDLPPGVLAYNGARPRGLAPDGPAPGAYDRPYVAPPEERPQERGLFAGIKSALPHMSPEAGRALMAAGLSMMASRSPYLGVAAGEGGLTGLNAYGAAETANREADVQERKLGFEGQRVGFEAQRLKQADDLAKRTAATAQLIPDGKGNLIPNPAYLALKTAEAEINKKDRVTPGYREKADGSGWERIPGGPEDPTTIRENAAAKRLPGMSEEAMRPMVQSYLAGNQAAVLTGIGRGAQGSENLERFWGMVSEELKAQGLTGRDVAAARANFSAQSAAAKTSAVREANVAMAVEEARGTFPIALQRSQELPRGQFVPLNKAIQSVQAGTSSPELARFVTANQAVITAYSQAMSRTGVNTVNAQQHAEALLSTATSQEAYQAVIGQMQQEMDMALTAPEKVKERIMSGIRGGHKEESKPLGVAPSAPPAAKSGAPAANPGKPERVIQNGYEYQLGPDGNYSPVRKIN